MNVQTVKLEMSAFNMVNMKLMHWKGDAILANFVRKKAHEKLGHDTKAIPARRSENAFPMQGRNRYVVYPCSFSVCRWRWWLR